MVIALVEDEEETMSLLRTLSYFSASPEKLKMFLLKKKKFIRIVTAQRCINQNLLKKYRYFFQRKARQLSALANTIFKERKEKGRKKR